MTRSRLLTYALILVAVVFAVFGSIVTHDLVTWDDPTYVVFNPVVARWLDTAWGERLATPGLGYPVALPVAIYAATSAMGSATAPALIHLVSLLAHALNAVLVFLLARRWLDNQRWALAAALWWALHPVVVESVAWASNLKEALMVTGVLLAIDGMERSLDGARRSGYGLVIAGVVIGLLSKPTAVVIAPLLLVRGLQRRSNVTRNDLVAAIAVCAACLGWGLWASSTHGSLVAAQEAAFANRSYVATILASIGTQVKNYVVLGSNQPYYPLEVERFTVWSALGLSTTFGWAIAVFWTRRTDRQQLLWCLLALAVTWAPYSNLVPLPRITSDTYLYLPSVFVAIGIIGAVRLALERYEPGARMRRIAGIAVVTLLSSLAFSSLAQVARWSSTERLFEPLLGEPERLALPYSLIAYELHLSGKAREAAAVLDEAWPRLRRTRELPRFASEAYLDAGRPERAADAALSVLYVYGMDRATLQNTIDFLTDHDLPLPSDQRSRRVAGEAWAQWRALSPPAERRQRVDEYFRRQGVASPD